MGKLEALLFEAEVVSSLMVQMAHDGVGDTSFAVMADLGENGTEHECDLGVSETALRASAVIIALQAELEAKDNREAQPVACDIERIKRHALPAGECPKQSQVVLLSSLQRLLTAPPTPAVPECFQRLLHHAYGMTMGHDWNKGTMAGHHREKLCLAVEECRAGGKQ